jgi:hypothetical protein
MSNRVTESWAAGLLIDGMDLSAETGDNGAYYNKNTSSFC